MKFTLIALSFVAGLPFLAALVVAGVVVAIIIRRNTAPMPATEKSLGKLQAFNLLTLGLNSKDPVTRAESQFALQDFVRRHGKRECDAMFRMLKAQDQRKKI